MPAFLDSVEVKAKLTRKHEPPNKHWWERVEFEEPRRAWVIGKRLLSDGVFKEAMTIVGYDPGEPDFSWYYEPTVSFVAWLVVFDMHTNPVYVKEEDIVPNPGSDAARDMGCKCPVLDNCHGRGFPWGGIDPSFWVADDCPIHGHEVDKGLLQEVNSMEEA